MESQIQLVKSSLLSPQSANPLAEQFRALFTLKSLAATHPEACIASIAAAFQLDSALLKHEVAYVLGQIKHTSAIPVLNQVLRAQNEDPMVRHEAAEALGAISDLSSVPVLREFLQDANVSVRETCEIALMKIEWDHSPHPVPPPRGPTIDPAPAIAGQLSALQQRLMDSSLSLFERYRAMFGLRDLITHPPSGGDDVKAVHALSSGFADTSALFRHEIAYIFGQVSHPESAESLLSVLYNDKEVDMVRHEAAEALGSLGEGEKVKAALQDFAGNLSAPRVVRESCVVALDMWEYEASGEFQYANTLSQTVEV